MKDFMELLADVNGKVNDFVWVQVGLILLIGAGLLTTIVTKVFQISHLKHWWTKTIVSVFKKDAQKKEKGYAWHTAIGLQAVDGLKPSKYLIDTAIKNIEGDISIDEAQELLDMYYQENPKTEKDDRTEEADKVSVRIAKVLSEHAFSFTPNEYLSIHKKLFAGIYGHAGKLRDYNITKKEWVLDKECPIFSQDRNYIEQHIQRKDS